MVVRVSAWLLVATALLAPWPFGAVSPLWWGSACAVILFVGVVALPAATLHRSVDGLPRRVLFVAALVPLVGLLGLTPIPVAVADMLSPAGGALLTDVGALAGHALRPLSLDPAATLDAVTLAAAVVVVALVVARHAASQRRGIGLGVLFAVGGGLLAAFGLAQRLIEPDPQRMFWSVQIYEVGTPFGPYVNRNHFGGAMLLFSGVTAGLLGAALAARRRLLAVPVAALLLLQVVALLATTSRGAILGLAVAALAALFLSPGARIRWRVAPVLAIVAGVAVVGIARLGLLDDLSGRLFTLYGRWGNRFAVQRDALAVFAHFPLTGTGAGSFPGVYGIFQTIDDLRYFRDAHSDWVQFLMETGLVGAVAIGAVVNELRLTAERLRRPAEPTAWIGRGALAGVTGIAAHGFFETNLHIPANALLASVVVGLAYGSGLRHAPPPERSSREDRADEESPREVPQTAAGQSDSDAGRPQGAVS